MKVRATASLTGEPSLPQSSPVAPVNSSPLLLSPWIRRAPTSNYQLPSTFRNAQNNQRKEQSS